MTIRAIAAVCVSFLALSVGTAFGATISYTINFSGGGPGLVSIGPGSFSYDSQGQTGVTIGPPAALTNYMVPATLALVALVGTPVIFTQTSPSDDSIVLGKNGFVVGLSVDSVNGPDSLQLNTDGTWSLGGTVTSIGVEQTGTYSVTPAAVPEPASLGLLAAGCIGLVLRRKFRC